LPESVDVVVVGAGYAGLSAATKLTAAGLRVRVLEARGRVGGRVWNHHLGGGHISELGGTFVGPTQGRLLELAARTGVETFPTHDTGDNVEWIGGERHHYTGPIPSGDLDAMAEAVTLMLDLNLMALEVPLDAPWKAPLAAEWDAMTVQSWLDTEVEHPGARRVLGLGVEAVFSVQPQDLSLLHFLFYVHSAGGLTQLLGVTGCAQDRRFVGGAQEVAKRLARDLGDRVQLSSPVRIVAQDADGVEVHHDGGTVRASYVVVALPPALAGRLSYAPALPGLRDQLTQRVPMGTVIKCHLVYETPFWRETGFSGQVTADSGACRVMFDNSPADGSRGVLMGFVEGEEGRVWGARTQEERRAELVALAERTFGPQATQPVAYVDKVWADDEWARGGYAGVMVPGAWTSYGEALRTPVGRLHWAGTETALVWTGYIDGAIESGERAAHEVLERIGVPEQEWPTPLPNSGEPSTPDSSRDGA
jgi:monoamine oxidase